MEELETKKRQSLGECFEKRHGKFFVNASRNILQNNSLNVSGNNLKNTSWKIIDNTSQNRDNILRNAFEQFFKQSLNECIGKCFRGIPRRITDLVNACQEENQETLLEMVWKEISEFLRKHFEEYFRDIHAWVLRAVVKILLRKS